MSLNGVSTRLEWAEHHLKLLDEELRPLREAYRNPPITSESKHGGHLIEYTIGDIPKVPACLGFIFGDCLHNLRATLDNLIYTMAVDTDKPLTSDDKGALFFPLCESAGAFAGNLGRKAIDPLPTDAQAAIQGLQPYNGGDRAEWHPLLILRELSNIDKHRCTPIVALSAGPHRSLPGLDYEFIGNSLESNTEFCRVTVPDGSPNVDVAHHFTFHISLDWPDRFRGRDVFYWGAEIAAVIRDDVLPALSPFCKT